MRYWLYAGLSVVMGIMSGGMLIFMGIFGEIPDGYFVMVLLTMIGLGFLFAWRASKVGRGH